MYCQHQAIIFVMFLLLRLGIPEKSSWTGYYNTLPDKNILILSSSVTTWIICSIINILSKISKIQMK